MNLAETQSISKCRAHLDSLKSAMFERLLLAAWWQPRDDDIGHLTATAQRKNKLLYRSAFGKPRN